MAGSCLVLGLDPGLTHVGVAIASVRGVRKVEITRTFHLEIPPNGSLESRVVELALALSLRLPKVVDEAIVENPAGEVFAPNARTHGLLSLATGVAIAQVASRLVAPTESLRLVGVSTWYPRMGRKMAPKEYVLAALKQEFPRLDQVTEHELMAAGLVSWWSTHNGIRRMQKLGVL